MPRVLIVSYYFPPAGGPAVQRVLGMVRHLPTFGWDPVVLTVCDGTFMNRDEAALADIPSDVPVYHARSIEPFALYNRLRGRPADEALPLGHTGTTTPGIVGRLAAYARANLFIPDARIGWLPFATSLGRRVIASEHIDAILTSSPPQTTHLIGRRLAKKTGIPWIADFRDPWTQIYYNAELPRTRLARRLDERLERRCIEQANRVVVVNDYVRDSLSLGDKHVDIITNGFEESDFSDDVEPISDRFALVYVGNLIASLGETETLFRVLGEMARDPSFREALRLQFVGRVHDRAREELAKHGLLDCAEFSGFVPHAEAVRQLRRATVALFIGPGDILGTKIFEYIATGRPLLPLASPDGDVDRLLASCGRERTVAHNDAAGIRERLGTLYEQWRTDALPTRAPMDGVTHLTRRALTGRLAEVLDAAVGRTDSEP